MAAAFGKIVQPLLLSLDPEKAHSLSLVLLKLGLFPKLSRKADKKLSIDIAGLKFPNPLGMAAGYDKNADVFDSLLALGFGHVEIGTITPFPQRGNTKPRVFRFPHEKGIINRLGFNNKGHHHVIQVLARRIHKTGIVGVNIGANKNSEDFIADYVSGIQRFEDLANYLTINISSPNTPGLRNLQDKNRLINLLNHVDKVRKKTCINGNKRTPIFLKIAPDLSEQDLDNITSAVLKSDIDALIVSNTTLSRDGLFDSKRAPAGGLSGAPLFDRSTRILAHVYQRLEGRIPLIGVGGVVNTVNAISKIEAGASLVQIYTGLIYKGPYLVSKMLDEISQHLKKNNLNNLSELIGKKANMW
ncbi:quinone-dependent dihydroorotate dehydrogenase [Candidatus Endowatersipora endosymbiont of Watersipora subatra]|uniref:quinone-dependent dihydroorotate dehydrogenase n=1 Tax=Candidatus Endowatersipora endosymbiont of Watersipora subatra TaxID=3077946 RepID=UPI003C7E417C